MTIDARACAALVLSQVTSDGRSLSEALPAAVQAITDARQRALVQELSYGTLRWYYRLDAMLQRLLKKPSKESTVLTVIDIPNILFSLPRIK